MKNIHVVATPNTSRIYFNIGAKYLGLRDFSKPTCVIKPNQNIYITNDEEIKEGDWFIHTSYDSTSIQKAIEISNHILDNQGMISNKENNSKIILTTDEDLIKDGVQAIDDEFLEWFVKNPSCEEVQVEQEILKLVHNPNYVNHTPKGDGIYLTPKSEDLQYGETLIEDNVIDYKIIIPKQELERGITITNVGKQETLSEAALKYSSELQYFGKESGFRAGAKWQQERSYSKEEVLAFGKFCIDKVADFLDGKGDQSDSQEHSMEELFEQFKKK